MKYFVLFLSLFAISNALSQSINELLNEATESKVRVVPRNPKVVEVSLSLRLRSTILRASDIIVCEGLPHQNLEEKSFKKELARKDTIRIGDYPFYSKAKWASKKDRPRLQLLLSDDLSFRRYGPMKLCGAFHPDYAINWFVEDKSFAALVCFGCHEIIFISDKDRFRYDLNQDSYRTLKNLLKAYRDERPKTKG